MNNLSKAEQKKEKYRAEMRLEFITAALQIIDEQGADALSTRKLSAVTGYSYATLYNHFPNISALFQYCIHDHMLKMNENVLNHPSLSNLNSRERVKQLSKLFTEYLLLHPKTFELIFLVPLTAAPPEEISDALLNPQIILDVRTSMFDFLKKTTVEPADYETIIQVLLSHLIGRLIFYFRRTPAQDDSLFKRSIEKEVEWILENIERGSIL